MIARSTVGVKPSGAVSVQTRVKTVSQIEDGLLGALHRRKGFLLLPGMGRGTAEAAQKLRFPLCLTAAVGSDGIDEQI